MGSFKCFEQPVDQYQIQRNFAQLVINTKGN